MYITSSRWNQSKTMEQNKSLNISTIDISGQKIVVGTCSVHCDMFRLNSVTVFKHLKFLCFLTWFPLSNVTRLKNNLKSQIIFLKGNIYIQQQQIWVRQTQGASAYKPSPCWRCICPSEQTPSLVKCKESVRLWTKASAYQWLLRLAKKKGGTKGSFIYFLR